MNSVRSGYFSADTYLENEWGLCTGTRQCKASGLTACSAAVPGKELCDGKDNDCDGQKDEGFPDTDNDGVSDCIDLDDDGDLDPDDSDCAALDPAVHHGAEEVCFNGVDEDCDGVADGSAQCAASSCLALLAKFPGTPDGAYFIDPDAKYPAFNTLKVTTLKGCLDGHCYNKGFNGTKSAREIFAGVADYQGGLPGFGDGPFWSTQPNCQHFGVNTPFQYQQTRFGYTANQEGDCSSNDTGIGFGLSQNPDGSAASRRGAGYLCLSSNCSKGNVNEGASGFPWAK